MERELEREVIEEARDRKERGGGGDIAVRLLAPCPVTIIKDSPLGWQLNGQIEKEGKGEKEARIGRMLR